MADNVTSLQPRTGDAEWNARVELAAAFRVAHHLGWNDTPRNHIAARLPDAPEHFLMNPEGLGWHEVTASSLLKLHLDGTVISETDRKPAPAGLNFHSCILRLLPEAGCSLHIHEPSGVAVSCIGGGLRFYDQGACALYGDVAYHDFEGLAQDEEEGPRIVADLGGRHAMIMHNHGLLTVGRNVGEAFCYMQRLVAACELQVRLESMNGTPREVRPDVAQHTAEQMAARRGDSAYGAEDWAMYLRLAGKIAPDFRT